MKREMFTVSPFWDARVKDNKGESRIMLTINLNGKQFRITLKLRSTKADFDRALSVRGGSESAKGLRQELSSYIAKAESILERLPEVTKDTFSRLFKSETDLFLSNRTCAFSMYQIIIDELKAEERFGTASNYRFGMNGLKSYKDSVFLEDINDKFIKAYKKHLLDTGKSISTANMYLRSLRRVFNYAIKNEIISSRHYPFKNMALGSSRRTKEVLYPLQLKALWNYEPVGIREGRAIAFFFFCYLGNGMNFKDVAMLRYGNIKGNILSFIREKTKNTTKEPKEIRVYVTDELKRIIQVWGGDNSSPENYIFPMMKKYKSTLHFLNTIKRYKKYANRSLRSIGEKLGFDVPLTLHLARHSFATTHKLAGTAVAFISDAMGHESITTTEHYLKTLPDDNLRDMSSKLLAFNGQ